MRQQIEAVIFDADGTLVDSETPGLDVLHEQALALGLSWEREALHERFRGVRMAECAASLAAEAGRHEPEFAEAFMRQVRAAMAERFRRGLSPMAGAEALLRRLTLPFCIATNGPREKVELTLGLTGLLPLVQHRLYSAYEVGSFKPEPGLFLHAAAGMGVAPARCAVVEDSLPGVEAGLAAGMQVFTLLPRQQAPLALQDRAIFIRELAELERYF
ncbi:MAG: HAD-IA family hydrolase [Burkholderiales bacterium]|nr:HAD-IA family hydrolase [Burkholderiales bacterium]